LVIIIYNNDWYREVAIENYESPSLVVHSLRKEFGSIKVVKQLVLLQIFVVLLYVSESIIGYKKG